MMRTVYIETSVVRYGADFLLTWNCKHIANAVICDRIEAVCRANGMTVPLLCTPLELLEDPDGLA